MRLLAIPAAIVALGITASTASAGTLTLNPSIQGAGQITGTVECHQDAGIPQTTILTCPQAKVVNSGGNTTAVSIYAEAAPGWKFDGWTDCAIPVGSECKFPVGSDPSWAVAWSPRAKFIDSQHPTTTFGPLVRWTTQERTVTVSWSSDEPGVTYKCGLDVTPQTACTSPYVLTAPAGVHKFSVAATDASGNMEKAQWIDVELLDTEITGGPDVGVFTSATSARFDLKGGPTIECSLDGAAYATCKSPITYSGLADGTHTLLARSRHNDLLDPIPAKRSWTVDTTAPETNLGLEDDAPTFSFSSSEPGSTFKCSVDGGAFAPCTTPRPAAGLAIGTHEFAVKAIDRAGNEDPTPAKRRWTVEEPATPAPAPEPVVMPVIVAAPPKIGLSFRYVAGRKGTTFSRLAVTGLPAGSKLTVIVTSPDGRRRALSSLKPLVGRQLKPGTKIAVAGKTITIRRSRAPKVV